MAGRIVINSERCKGCGLCVSACPRRKIGRAKLSNRNGFFPAAADPQGCNGCGLCAIVCPDAVITVYREPAITEVKSGRRARKAVGVLKEKP